MAPTNKVWFGVLGTNIINFVVIPRHETGADLQAAIYHHSNHRFQEEGVTSAGGLQLFILGQPAQGDRRLQLSKALKAFLGSHPTVPTEGFKELKACEELNGDTCFGATTALPEDEIHVLVQLHKTEESDERPPKRIKMDQVQWVHVEGTFNSLMFGNDARWVTIPRDYIDGSGVELPQENGPLVLYRRKEFENEWNKIQACAMDRHARLYIVGAPGTGKSCAAYAFACGRVDREQWMVVWIHWSAVGRRFLLVTFDGDTKATARLRVLSTTALDGMLRTLGAHRGSKGILVFLDGYDDAEKCFKDLESFLINWQVDDHLKRRFVCVTSQPTLHKLKFGKPLSRGIYQNTLYQVASWTLDEYVEAVKDKSFVSTVEGLLRMDEDNPKASEPTSIVDLVCHKYFFAGGSARHMFCSTIKETKDDLKAAMKGVTDMQSVLNGSIGLASSLAINRLFAHYRSRNKSRIVSVYAARKFVKQIGADHIQDLARRFGFNPALDGMLFEQWFFISLVSDGVRCFAFSEGESTVREVAHWRAKQLPYFSPTSDPFELHRSWNAPEKWKHAGYDAVLWEDQPIRRLLFVQSTRGKDHKNDAAPFLEFLRLFATHWRILADGGKTKETRTTVAPPLDSVDLYYVVPKARLREFKAPTNSKSFRDDVVHKVGKGWVRLAADVRVVGVNYEMSEEDDRTFAPAQPPPALRTHEEAFSAEVQEALAQVAPAAANPSGRGGRGKPKNRK